MAASQSLGGPDARTVQPDPIMTNVMADSSKQGGWIADIVAPVKAVQKDYVRHGQRDTQTLLSTVVETIRAPGAMPNLLNQTIKTWLTAIITERALRVEVAQEDIDNSMSPEEPFMDAAQMIQNGLRFAIEAVVLALFDPANFDANHKTAAAFPWSGATTTIQEDIDKACVQCVLNGGLRPNSIIIPYKKWPSIWASDEVRKAIGFGYRQDALDMNGGLPPTFFGLKPYVPGGRTDTVPTGTFTPAFVWDDDNIRLFYTPSANGEAWNGSDPVAFGQYENQTHGTAFVADRMQDPMWRVNKLWHAWGSVRRSPAKAINQDHAYVITGA